MITAALVLFFVGLTIGLAFGYLFGKQAVSKLEAAKGAAAREVDSDLRLMATLTDEQFAKLRARCQVLTAAARKDL
jgi:hypothetical protein